MANQLEYVERGGGVPQAYVHAPASSNAVFGARFKGLSLYFLSQKGILIRIQNALGYISDTYPNPYPLVTVPPL